MGCNEELPLPRNGYPGTTISEYVKLKRIEKFKLLLKKHNPGCNLKQYPILNNIQKMTLENEIKRLENE